MNTRSFFKSLALLTAGAAVAPGIFIPKFEPVRWKVKKGVLTAAYLQQAADELDADAKRFYGKWQFETTVWHFQDGVWVKSDGSHDRLALPIPNGEWISVTQAVDDA